VLRSLRRRSLFRTQHFLLCHKEELFHIAEFERLSSEQQTTMDEAQAGPIEALLKAS
jgi:hypothetical protein